MGLRAAFRTFGCKLNQAETECIADSFAAAGATIVRRGEPADVIVFNTCTVTSKAEQKARREMRLALRLNPDAIAIVTGCYAELDPVALSSVAERAIVVPGSRKDSLRAMAEGLSCARANGDDLLSEARRIDSAAAGSAADPFSFEPGHARSHSRVQLKVQDGCDNRCTYCRVCLARGPSVSLNPEEILRRVVALEADGVPEIVLSGVNLSQYRSGGIDFAGLLEYLGANTSVISFRISSYEPDRVDGAFIRAFSIDRVRPHLHLSVQSGSDTILGAMGRRYSRDVVYGAVEGIRAVKDDPFIGADIILGFPGESDHDFDRTVDLLRRIEPAWIHAFTFSPRPGTQAFAMRGRIPERVAVERAAVVQDIAKRGKARFAARRLGRRLEAVAEIHDHSDDDTRPVGAVIATSTEYLKLLVRGAPRAYRGALSCVALLTVLPGSSNDGVDLIGDYL